MLVDGGYDGNGFLRNIKTLERYHHGVAVYGSKCVFPIKKKMHVARRHLRPLHSPTENEKRVGSTPIGSKAVLSFPKVPVMLCR